MQAGAQVGRDSVGGRGAGGGDLVQQHEAVDQAGLTAQFDIDARVPQTACIGLRLVSQGVVLGGDDQRAGQPGQVGGVQRADTRVGPPRAVWHPLGIEEPDRVGVQAQPAAFSRMEGWAPVRSVFA